MRVDVKGEALKPEETVTEQPEEEKDQDDNYIVYDPATDVLGKWLATFTHTDFARDNPDMSVYARIIRQLRIKSTDHQLMMAVTIDQGRHTLLYNKEWAAQVTFLEIVATLAHEAFHILGNDIPTALRYLAGFPAKQRPNIHALYNVALDAANNSLLAKKMRHMKYGSTGYWVLPEPMGYKPDLDADIYMQFLLERQEEVMKIIEELCKQGKMSIPGMPGFNMPGDGNEDSAGQPQPGDGDGDADGEGKGGLGPDDIDWDKYGPVAEAVGKLLQQNAHDWISNKLEEMAPEEIEALASNVEGNNRNIAVNALKEHKKQCGSLPAHLQNRLTQLLEEDVVPWSAVLSKLIAAQMLAKRRATMNRPAKRRFIMFEEDEEGNYVRRTMPAPAYPGAKRDREFVILFAIDTSGSMSEAEVVEGLSEVQGLLKRSPGSHCIVVQCDTHISAVDILGPDMDVEKYIETVGRTSGGGTHFHEPFKLANFISGRGDLPRCPDGTAKLVRDYAKVDLVVYHTDTYGSPPAMDLHPGCPTLWTVPRGGNVSFNPDFGQIIVRE